jgi:phosphocarrier protein
VPDRDREPASPDGSSGRPEVGPPSDSAADAALSAGSERGIERLPDGRLRLRVAVVNPMGFHMRPMTRLVETVSKFQAKVFLEKAGVRADARSIMQLLGIASEAGVTLTAEADGADAALALACIRELFATGFDNIDGDIPESGSSQY